MPTYKAPLEDVNFLLNDVFQIDRYDNLPGFSDASADVREAVLGEAAKLQNSPKKCCSRSTVSATSKAASGMTTVR